MLWNLIESPPSVQLVFDDLEHDSEGAGGRICPALEGGVRDSSETEAEIDVGLYPKMSPAVEKPTWQLMGDAIGGGAACVRYQAEDAFVDADPN